MIAFPKVSMLMLMSRKIEQIFFWFPDYWTLAIYSMQKKGDKKDD